jgi:hypothetical protein
MQCLGFQAGLAREYAENVLQLKMVIARFETQALMLIGGPPGKLALSF